ncbi:M10 family metallopeptidase C-terminal domain-containing protein, partial [Methylobacterium sp. A54F]
DDNYGLTGPVVGVGTESLGRSVAELVAGHKVLQGGTKNDAIGGTAAGDYLFGGAGRDWLSGGGGDDVIEGGADRDYLTGGAGADTFVFRGFNVGQDYIEDFVHGEDRIHLAELPGAPKSAANWSLIGAERFSGSPWQLRTVEGKGITSIQLDRDGDMRADLQIDFKGSHRFTTADFILVTGEP